jgi:hypothetical protein
MDAIALSIAESQDENPFGHVKDSKFEGGETERAMIEEEEDKQGEEAKEEIELADNQNNDYDEEYYEEGEEE